MKYLCVVQQWLPESMDWKECIAGEFDTFDAAEQEAARLRRPNRQAFVTSRPASGEGGAA